MNTLVQNVRVALRRLRRNPGVAAVTVLSLALGIGANAAIFSVVDACYLPAHRASRVDPMIALRTE